MRVPEAGGPWDVAGVAQSIGGPDQRSDAFQKNAAGFVQTYRRVKLKSQILRNRHQMALPRWADSCWLFGGALVAISGRQLRELLRTCVAHLWQWMPRRDAAHG